MHNLRKYIFLDVHFSTTGKNIWLTGSGKRISITMTTAWRCAPCQQMWRIQINQWSGSWACNLLAKIEFIRCGWLRWREWGCVGLAAPRQIMWPLREQTRVRQYPPAVTAIKISALLPGAMLTSKSGEHLDRPQPGLQGSFCVCAQPMRDGVTL